MTTTDKKWLDEMIMELRLREVRGTAIGDAVAQVEAHCAESGETPAEAFGEPRAYARSLDFPAGSVQSTQPVDWARTLLPVGAGLVAINLVGPVVQAAVDRTTVALSWGWVAALSVLALGVLLGVRIIGALLTSRINFALYFGGLLTATVALGVLWEGHAFGMPVWLGALLVVALLAAATAGMHRSLREDDPIVDPRSPQERPGRALHTATTWLFVVVAVGMALLRLVPLLLR